MVRLKFNHQDKMVMASVQQNAVPNPGNDTEKTTLVTNTFKSGHYGRYSKEMWTTFCACLGPLSLGCVLGYSSPSLPDLTTDGLLVGNQKSWYGSLITIGALCGSYAAGWMVEKYGRKSTIIYSAPPYVIGWLLLTAAEDFVVLYIGRIVTGFAGGMTTLCVPLYIAEVSSKQIRGILGASFQIGTTTGILVVYTVGLYLSWRWLAIFCAVFPTMMILLIQFSPETPRYLLLKGNKFKAVQSLSILRKQSLNNLNITLELEDIQRKIEEDSRIQSSWFDFKLPSLQKPLFLSLSLMILQQFCGINAVIFYTESIFQTASYNGNPGVPSVIVAAVKVAATCFSTSLMDNVGRRKLFICGRSLMTISCISFGMYFYLSDVHMVHSISWLSLGSLILYVTAFSLGWGSIPWLIMSEIFPTKVRGRASALATGLNWTCAFLVTLGFLPLENAISSQGIFWLFAGVCCIGTLAMFFFMPETKGKSLEEIEHFFNRN